MDVYLSLINGVINAKKHMKWDNGAMQVCWCSCACMPPHASVKLVSVDCQAAAYVMPGMWDKLAVRLHSSKAFFYGMPWPSAHACMAVLTYSCFRHSWCRQHRPAAAVNFHQALPSSFCPPMLVPTHDFLVPDCVLTGLLRLLSRPFSCTASMPAVLLWRDQGGGICPRCDHILWLRRQG